MNKLSILKFSKNPSLLLKMLRDKPEQYWLKRGERSALNFFHQMASRVPAYKDFLRKNRIKPNSIRSIEDFRKLPTTDKENYLQNYKLEDLCWDGKFKQENWMISSTSGSTGEPFYFPRTRMQEVQFTLTAELCLMEYFEIHKKSTLFVDCFALGVWIGGMFMYQAIRNIMNKGEHGLSIITPGADKVEAIKAIKKIGHLFDQIIIGGYGPLVKDLVDDGILQGLNWKKYNIKYFFAAEGFTENFRDYISDKGGARNVYTDLINHYGTADLGTMAHETPASILIRRLALSNDSLFKDFFHQATRLPTLTQFIPELFYFESPEGKLVCSGPGGLPLLRYDLKDRGNVVNFEQMKEKLQHHNINFGQEARKHSLQFHVWQLPFVYLYERADLTVSIYSVNIYPESIRKALEEKEFGRFLTGKFSMQVDFDKNQNQYLQINIELRPGINTNSLFEKQVLLSIINWLDKENSEWRDFYADDGIKNKVTPKIVFWPYQDPMHFRPGGKQKWVKKIK